MDNGARNMYDIIKLVHYLALDLKKGKCDETFACPSISMLTYD